MSLQNSGCLPYRLTSAARVCVRIGWRVLYFSLSYNVVCATVVLLTGNENNRYKSYQLPKKQSFRKTALLESCFPSDCLFCKNFTFFPPECSVYAAAANGNESKLPLEGGTQVVYSTVQPSPRHIR